MIKGDTESTRSGQKLQIADIYGASIQLATHGQDNKLNLFSSFLVFQSILLLAWVTVWQAHSPGGIWMLLIFSGFAVLSSVIWAALGRDYCDAAEGFNQTGAGFEKHYFPVEVSHLLATREEIVKGKPKWMRGRFLILCVTLGFAFLYFFLDLSLLWKPILTHYRCGGGN